MKTLRVWLFALLSVFTGAAGAHEMSIAEMQIREVSAGEFMWAWTATSDRSVDYEGLTPRWPAGCRADDVALHCGAAGLQGEMRVDGVGKSYSAAMVKVSWLDGQARVYTLTSSQPTVQLYGSADDKRGWGEIATAYVMLGVEHILSGIDHLLFVVGLLFLVGFRKRLLWAITAFTAAHSLTLASAALGLLTLRSPPVEACIALSIVLVVSEALRSRETLARRFPALVAFIFGLVHGLGFAGALKDIGLPESHLAIALLSFNVGVEIGQLMTIGLCWGVTHLLARHERFRRLRTPALYVIGALAAYWSWGRLATIGG